MVRGGDQRVHGAAQAFEEADIGNEIEKSQAAPGDFVQTFSKGLGGHCTMVHRAYLTGAAVFGLPDSPTLLDGPTPEKPTALGFEGQPVTFLVDEKTDPNLVGEFVSDQVELLGAHTEGTNSEGTKEDQGVYTKKATNLESHYRAYVGRLNSSTWAGRDVADPQQILAEFEAVKSSGGGSWWNPFDQ